MINTSEDMTKIFVNRPTDEQNEILSKTPTLLLGVQENS